MAVMFADMTGSTRLYDNLGNTVAVDIVTQCISALIRVVGNHRGRVIKTIGDEVMCTFPEAVHAALAASEMHMGLQRLVQSGSVKNTEGLQVKVGVHYGVVLEEDNDIFGDAVNVAARMASLAKADQTLVTQQLVDAMPRELHSTLRFYDKVDLRGKSERFDVYEIIWQVSDMTVAANTRPTVARRELESLELRFADRRLELNASNPAVGMGRADDNEVQCAGSLTSRRHARIEFKRGRFVLTDQSSNGTYVKPDGEDMFILRRDYSHLEGAGFIGLGESPDDMGKLAIRYQAQ